MGPVNKSAIRRFFAGMAEYTFQTNLGVVDPPLIDYLSDLLARFVRNEAVYRVRDPRGRRLVEGETEVGIGRCVHRGSRGVAFRASILEDQHGEELRVRCGRAAIRPDRENPFAASVWPTEATVHLQRAGSVPDAPKRDRRRERDRFEKGSLVVFDPDGDLRALGRRERELEQPVAFLCLRPRRAGETKREDQRDKPTKAHDEAP